MFWSSKASREGSAVERERSDEIAALEHQVKVLTLTAEAEEVKARAAKATAEIEKANTERTRERVGRVRSWIFLEDGKGKSPNPIDKIPYVLAGAGVFGVTTHLLQVLFGGR
jgi:hypothetical protein